MPSTFLPWAWAIGAVVVALLELVTPGSYLIWIACAAAITAIATFVFGLALSAQLTLFAVSCVVSCSVGYFVYRRVVTEKQDHPGVNRRDLDLVGTSGVVAENFTSGRGRVRVGDSLWLAEATADYPAGTPVRITAVRDTTLLVEKRP